MSPTTGKKSNREEWTNILAPASPKHQPPCFRRSSLIPLTCTSMIWWPWPLRPRCSIQQASQTFFMSLPHVMFGDWRQILFPSSTHHVHIDRSWLLSKIRYLHRWLDRPTHPYIFFSVPRSTQVNSYIHHATMNHGHVHTMDMIQNFALWSNSATEVTHMYSLVYTTSIPGSPY